MIEAATERNLPIIDLRATFNDKRDYACVYQASEVGGRKIASLICQAIKSHDFFEDKEDGMKKIRGRVTSVYADTNQYTDGDKPPSFGNKLSPSADERNSSATSTKDSSTATVSSIDVTSTSSKVAASMESVHLFIYF